MISVNKKDYKDIIQKVGKEKMAQIEQSSQESASEPAQKRSSASYLAANKINKLHQQVLNGLKSVCTKAIAIGKVLVEQKDALEHGAWLDWIDSELDIGPRQVQNYMGIYRQREAVLESMNKHIEAGLKPSIRRMLLAASSKDTQSMAEFEEEYLKKSRLRTPAQKKQQQRAELRTNEIAALVKMYRNEEIDDKALRALILKWNRDNPDNNDLYLEEIKSEIQRLDDEWGSDIFDPDIAPKTNVMLSIDTDLWDEYVEFGGREVFLNDFVTQHLTEYVIEQKSYRSN